MARLKRIRRNRFFGNAVLLAQCLIAMAFFLGATSCFASVWYVNNIDGRDTNTGLDNVPGKTGFGPFRSIGRALRSAKAGDTIVLENTGRPYYEPISLSGGRHSGIPGRPFQLLGNGSTVSGLIPVDKTKWKALKTEFYKLPNKNGNFGQLYHNGRPLPFQKLTIKSLDELSPMHWTLIDGSFYFRTEDEQLASTLNIQQSYHMTGVTLYNVENVVVKDLVVQGFALDGFNIFDGVHSSELNGINSRGNGRSGLSVGGAAKILVSGSTIGDNLKSQIRTEQLGSAEVKASRVLEFAHGTRLEQKGGEIKVQN